MAEKRMVETGDNCFLINIVEESVKNEVLKLIESTTMCQCEKCYLCACALALNALKPHYVTTTKGALLKKIDTYTLNYQTEILVAATRAVMVVKESPWHESHAYTDKNEHL